MQLLLHVRPLEGLVRTVEGTLEKRFGKKEVAVPIQVLPRYCLPVPEQLDEYSRMLYFEYTLTLM